MNKWSEWEKEHFIEIEKYVESWRMILRLEGIRFFNLVHKYRLIPMQNRFILQYYKYKLFFTKGSSYVDTVTVEHYVLKRN